MAQYYATTRTNYFRLKEKVTGADLKNLLQHLDCEDKIEFWEESNGRFGFGALAPIRGYVETQEDKEPDFDMFVQELQDMVATDDAIIILESGHEKLRYTIGSALIITSDQVIHREIKTVAELVARELLKNPAWTTELEY